MDVRELEKALKDKLGLYVRFIGIYSSDRIPFIQYSAKPALLIANTLKSGIDINTIGHWVAFYFEFQPQKRVISFSSYGLPPQFYINSRCSDFLKKYDNTPIYHYGKQLQPDNSMKCGLCSIIHPFYFTFRFKGTRMGCRMHFCRQTGCRTQDAERTQSRTDMKPNSHKAEQSWNRTVIKPNG